MTTIIIKRFACLLVFASFVFNVHAGVFAEVSGRMSVQPYIGRGGIAKASVNMHCNVIKVHGGKSSHGEQDSDASAKGKPKIENIIISNEGCYSFFL